MKIDHRDTGISHMGHKPVEPGFRVHIINTDPAFDGDRQVGGRTHRRHTIGNQRWFCHETGPKSAGLDTI